jgi:hypothetical protein
VEFKANSRKIRLNLSALLAAVQLDLTAQGPYHANNGDKCHAARYPLGPMGRAWNQDKAEPEAEQQRENAYLV